MASKKRKSPSASPRGKPSRFSSWIVGLVVVSLLIGFFGFYFNSQTEDLAQTVFSANATLEIPTGEPPAPRATSRSRANARPTAAPSPPAALAVSRVDKTMNVLLLGSDRRPDDPVWRTDAMMIVFIDTANGRAAILSLPRDLFVDIPTRGGDRINIADFWGEYTKYPGGGPGLLKKVIADNFGIRVDHWARVDFEGFKQIVDTLGGIEVNVPCELQDDFVDPTSPTGFRRLQVDAGINHMDGDTALMYVRQRHNTGDISRARRQQQVVYALREKLLSPGTIPRLPALYQQLQDAVQTDFGTIDLPGLIQVGTSVNPADIRGRVIDETMWNFWTTPDGKSVLVFDKDKVRAAVDDLFNAPPVDAVNEICQ